MSAYIVSKRHIDAMITGALDQARRDRSPSFTWYVPRPAEGGGWEYTRRDLTNDNADEVGVMLWTENVRSVRYRYPDDAGDELPGPDGFTPGEADAYRFQRLWDPLTDGELIRAIMGYEYQTCEHPGWRDPSNPVRALCDALLRSAVYELPDVREAVAWRVKAE